MKKQLFALLLLALAAPTYAQTLFQDAGGKSSLFVPADGQVSLNTADAKVSASYLFQRSDNRFGIGGTISGKSSSGFASLISGESLSPAAAFELNLTYRLPVKDEPGIGDLAAIAEKISDAFAAYDELTDEAEKKQKLREIERLQREERRLKAEQEAEWGKQKKGEGTPFWMTNHHYVWLTGGPERNTFKRFDPSLPVADQLFTEKQTLYQARIGYTNWLLHRQKDGDAENLVLGGMLTFNKTHNFGSLSKLEVSDVRQVGDSTLSRAATKTTTAYEGVYNTFNTATLDLDAVLLPAKLKGRLGLGLFSRNSYNLSNERLVHDAGFGIYLNQAGNPLKTVGGIVFQLNDLSDAKESGKSLVERGSIGIVTGYRF